MALSLKPWFPPDRRWNSNRFQTVHTSWLSIITCCLLVLSIESLGMNSVANFSFLNSIWKTWLLFCKFSWNGLNALMAWDWRMISWLLCQLKLVWLDCISMSCQFSAKRCLTYQCISDWKFLVVSFFLHIVPFVSTEQRSKCRVLLIFFDNAHLILERVFFDFCTSLFHGFPQFQELLCSLL